jgi:hypothetical protein
MTFAQPIESPKTLPPAGKSAPEIKELKERVAFWLKTCLEDWDAATHMTQKEWRTTCNRVAVERGNFLLQNPASFSMKGRPR